MDRAAPEYQEKKATKKHDSFALSWIKGSETRPNKKKITKEDIKNALGSIATLLITSGAGVVAGGFGTKGWNYFISSGHDPRLNAVVGGVAGVAAGLLPWGKSLIDKELAKAREAEKKSRPVREGEFLRMDDFGVKKQINGAGPSGSTDYYRTVSGKEVPLYDPEVNVERPTIYGKETYWGERLNGVDGKFAVMKMTEQGDGRRYYEIDLTNGGRNRPDENGNYVWKFATGGTINFPKNVVDNTITVTDEFYTSKGEYGYYYKTKGVSSGDTHTIDKFTYFDTYGARNESAENRANEKIKDGWEERKEEIRRGENREAHLEDRYDFLAGLLKNPPDGYSVGPEIFRRLVFAHMSDVERAVILHRQKVRRRLDLDSIYNL